jgi:hypothetical protein
MIRDIVSAVKWDVDRREVADIIAAIWGKGGTLTMKDGEKG